LDFKKILLEFARRKPFYSSRESGSSIGVVR
jgi:hypothetical protein